MKFINVCLENLMRIEFVKPTLQDVPSMQQLVQPEVDSGIILERSYDEVSTNIRSYTLAKVDNELIGFCALHVHTFELAEIRSLIVAKDFRNKKIGQGLVLSALEEGKRLGLKKVLSLTYGQAFFEKLGFEVIQKESLPEHKIWADCIKCKHFPVCNEVALIKNL